MTEETKRPEPQPVGHRVVQDNVSEPGVQHTHEVDEEGAVLRTSSHGRGGEPKAEAPAEEEGEVESDSALVGSGPGAPAAAAEEEDAGEPDDEE